MRYIIALSGVYGPRIWAELTPNRGAAITININRAQRMPNKATAERWAKAWRRHGLATRMEFAPEDTISVKLGLAMSDDGSITTYVDGEAV